MVSRGRLGLTKGGDALATSYFLYGLAKGGDALATSYFYMV